MIYLRNSSDTAERNPRLVKEVRLRKKAELEARRLEKELEEKTRQLEAAQLELEAFTYSVSHDLRAPIRNIKGYSDLLGKELASHLDEETVQYLAAISRGADRVNKLLTDLLQFSRAARSPLSLANVEPDALAMEAVRELRNDFEGRSVDVQIEKIPAIQADAKLLRQAFNILLSNALKFTRHNVATRIEVGSLPPSSTDVTIYVRDNGVGFDGQYASKLFQPFVRLHSLVEYEGSALGLAALERIVGRHGGRCWAEGREGEGATIYFTLPLPTREPSNGHKRKNPFKDQISAK